MKKRISVLSLIFLFVVSTIGLPLSINICNMTGTAMAELCSMNSSCETGSHSIAVNTEITKSKCCQTDIIDKAISDKYIQVNLQKINPGQNIVVYNNENFSVNSSLTFNYSDYFNDSSPPSLSNNHIYLNNSILLI